MSDQYLILLPRVQSFISPQNRLHVMKIDEKLLEKILDQYPIDTWSDFEYLDSGFHSDNVKISTSDGELVVRQIFDDPLSINRMMFIYDFLSQHQFPTAVPVKTRDDKYFATLVDQYYVVQKFIDGEPPVTETKEEAITVSRIVGEAIGKFHSILQDLDYSTYKNYSPNFRQLDIISWLTSVEINDEGIYFPRIRKTLENEYVKRRYLQWIEKLEIIELNNLQQGICHNDIKLADFRFQDGEFVGLLDFGSAEYSFHLYDIAGYMMYTNLYTEQIAEMFLEPFVSSYLTTSKMELEEFKYLHFFIQARFFLQIFYFFTRIHTGDIQGVQNPAANQEGFTDGIAFLEHLDTIPEDFYNDLLGLST